MDCAGVLFPAHIHDVRGQGLENQADYKSLYKEGSSHPPFPRSLYLSASMRL